MSDERGPGATDAEDRFEPAEVAVSRMDVRARRLGHIEVRVDERPKRKVRVPSNALISRAQLGRCTAWLRIHESLGIREDPRELDVVKQRAELVSRIVDV